jgi:AcrR family transcriptional regulator
MSRDASHPDRRVARTQRALKAALTDLILEKGYEQVTVQDIIDRADMGRSTFYAHFVDRDELLLAILADLQVPGPATSAGKQDDPAFGWTLDLFRHFGEGRRIFRAVASNQSGAIGRRELTRWLDELARAELGRLRMPRRLEPSKLDIVARFIVGTFLGFMDWWMREENDQLPAEVVDQAFRSLVLPGLVNVLDVEMDVPRAL